MSISTTFRRLAGTITRTRQPMTTPNVEGSSDFSRSWRLARNAAANEYPTADSERLGALLSVRGPARRSASSRILGRRGIRLPGGELRVGCQLQGCQPQPAVAAYRRVWRSLALYRHCPLSVGELASA
jgi:hypothetical protein